MARAGSGTRRWVDLAKRVAAELPGEWSVRGRGLKAVLVREPIGWAPRWIGFEPAADYALAGFSGGLLCGVEPLVEFKMRWHLTYGLRLRDVPGAATRVDLDAADIDGQLRDFALVRAGAVFDEWTLDRIAGTAEAQLSKPLERRGPPHLWLAAPGLRVVRDSGSPEEPAADAAAFCRGRGMAEPADFFTTLLTRWRSGGQPAALEFLTVDRERKLAKEGLDKPIR